MSAAAATTATFLGLNPMQWTSVLQGVGGMAAGLWGLGNNPADAAMGYSEQLPGTVTPYYQPYIDTGLLANEQLYSQFNQLINNPQSIYDMLAGGFEQSPGYNWQYNNAMNAANNAAAAGGMSGTPAHQQQASTLAAQLANQDYYNYLNNMSGLYGQGLSGMQGINQMGYNASDSLAGLLAQNLMNQAMMSAMGQMNANSSMGGLIGGATEAVSGLF